MNYLLYNINRNNIQFLNHILIKYIKFLNRYLKNNN